MDRVAANEAETERNDLAALSPDKKPRMVGHPLTNGAKIIFSQRFKFQWRSLVNGQIQRIDFVDQRRDIVHNLQLNLWCALRFPKFSTQIFARCLAERGEVFVPICVWEWQPCHRHA